MEYEGLYNVSKEMRRLVVDAIYQAQSGHPGGSLSICEILTVLYFKQMNIDEKKPNKENRDRFVLSKGHAAPAYYAALAMRGFFPREDLKTLRKIDSYLQGHPCREKIPGVDMSTGSLGQGLSAANGMALYSKTEKKDFYVYCVCGDGELQEGQIWEAVMSASHYKLDNLILFVDQNKLQIDGRVENVMNVEPIADKFKAFGWSVYETDGHNIEALDETIEKAKKVQGAPSVIVCHTIKGKGVSYMENEVGWHGAAPNKEQYLQAMKELI